MQIAFVSFELVAGLLDLFVLFRTVGTTIFNTLTGSWKHKILRCLIFFLECNV